MSTALAIASVTAVLRDLLNNGLIDYDLPSSVGDVTVSALPPDRVDALQEKKSRLNLYMYQVTHNAGWRNVGLPSRNGEGERLSNPPLALDLHYLLTAYAEEEFHTEILLGYGMQILHETPVLTRAAIRKALAAGPPGTEGFFTSELAEQVEQIKIVPNSLSLSTEESSRMWSALGARYRPTAVYQASAVLIESRRPTRPALPVRERNIRVMPFRQPVIEQVIAQAGANEPIMEGSTLLIRGRRLSGDITRVLIAGGEAEPQEESDTQISLQLSPAALPDGLLLTGVQGVQVVHKFDLRGPAGSPPSPGAHRGFESNVAAFVLRPRIETISVSNVQGTGSDPRSADVSLSVKPAIGPTQRVVLLLNEFNPPLSPPDATEGVAPTYSFEALPRLDLQHPPASLPPPSENITIPISGVKAGTYLARVQVDGAQSPLGTDADGNYNSPQLLIP